MSRFDEELRHTLRERAERVSPRTDLLLAAVEQRARGIRRRRASLRAACAACAVLLVTVAVPTVVRHLERSAELAPVAIGGQGAQSAPPVTPTGVPLSSGSFSTASQPVPAGVVRLTWPARVDQAAPRQLRGRCEDDAGQRFARSHGQPPAAVARQALWVGPLPGARGWACVAQAWETAPARPPARALLYAYVADAAGGNLRYQNSGPVRFGHAAPDQDPAALEYHAELISLVTIALTRDHPEVLIALGHPATTRIEYYPDGVRPVPGKVRDGVAVFERPASVLERPGVASYELIASGSATADLTAPPDAHAVRVARELGLPWVPHAWGLDYT